MLLVGALDANFNEIRNPLGHRLAAAPGTAFQSQWFYNLTLDTYQFYTGTTWISVDPAKAANGSIPNTALATNPLARGNHTGSQDANTIRDLAATVQGYSLSSFAPPTADIPAGGFTFTGLRAPTAAGQAAEYTWTLGQIAAAIEGRNTKDAVRMASTGNLTLSGLQTVDGIAGAANDRVLVKNQTTAAQNGIYLMQSGAWTRAPDQNAAGEYRTGDYVFVQSGATQAASNWAVTTTGTITIGTTPVTWSQVGAGASYTQGNGLTLTGNVFAVGAGTGILVSPGVTAIDTAVVGRKFRGTITGDGSTTAFVVAHNLNNEDAAIHIVDRAGGDQVMAVTSGRTPNALTANITPVAAAGKVYGFTVLG